MYGGAVATSSGLTRVRHYASPVREQAVVAIRNQIMEGALRPGQRLVERELCEQLDVSRNTLREAYRQLEAEGFVEIPPHKGPIVRRVGADEVRSLYEIRQALEGLAIRLFTDRAGEEELVALQRAFGELRTAHDDGDIGEMLRRKRAFYEVLYRGTGNEILRGQAEVLQGRLAQMRARSLAADGRPRQSIEEIADVVSRIVARDAAGAEAAWDDHIHRAYLVVADAMGDRATSA